MIARHHIAHTIKYSWGVRILAMISILILSYVTGWLLMGKLLGWGLVG